MQVSFNPYSTNTNCRQKQSFKSIYDGTILAEELTTHSKINILLGLLDYAPDKLVKNYQANIETLNTARTSAAGNKSIGDSLIDLIDEAKEALTTIAREKGIIK